MKEIRHIPGTLKIKIDSVIIVIGLELNYPIFIMFFIHQLQWNI